MKTYWCGWEVPFGVPDEHIVARWPEGMRGWISGESCTRVIWVGRIDAESADKAWSIVLGCYGESADKIEQRWEPKPNELGWRPNNGRFPEPTKAAR